MASEAGAARARRGGNGTGGNGSSTRAYGTADGSPPPGDDEPGLTDAERLEFLLYLEQTLLGESSSGAATNEQEVYEALEREDAAWGQELAQFAGAYDCDPEEDGCDDVDRAPAPSPAAASKLVTTHGCSGKQAVGSMAGSGAAAIGATASASAAATLDSFAMDDDGDGEEFAPSPAAAATGSGGGYGLPITSSSILCPICRRSHLFTRGPAIGCRCGFRMDTAGGPSLDTLEASLAGAHGLHWERGCAAEPRFELSDQFGVRALLLVCDACGDLQVVL